MNKIQNVLLYYNEEFGRIAETVCRIVGKNQARLTILDVFDNFDQYLELLPPSSSIEELKTVVTAERKHEILGHVEKYPDISDRIDISFRFGNPVVETIKAAVSGEYDLVIKAASGKKTLKERLFGDVALKLLRKCPMPVLIVSPSGRGTFENILVPVDPERPDPSAEEDGRSIPLTRQLVQTALFMTRLQNSRLHILHCWSLPGETLLSGGRSRMDSRKLQQMLGLAKNIHTQRLDNLVNGFDFSGIDHSVTLL
jgi:nucleotide-binding universal stress UspA family protein